MGLRRKRREGRTDERTKEGGKGGSGYKRADIKEQEEEGQFRTSHAYQELVNTKYRVMSYCGYEQYTRYCQFTLDRRSIYNDPSHT